VTPAGVAAAPAGTTDVGNGLVCASFGTSGAWLALGTVHPVHGFVELNGVPRFARRWRGRAELVRRYRSWMHEDRFAFLRIEPADCVAWVVASAVPGERRIVLRAGLQRTLGERRALRVRFRGRLDRHAYAEITDTDPLPPAEARSQLLAEGATLRVRSPGLPAEVRLTVTLHGKGPLPRDLTWTVVGRREAALSIPRPPGGAGMTLDVSVGIEVPVLPPRSGLSDPGVEARRPGAVGERRHGGPRWRHDVPPRRDGPELLVPDELRPAVARIARRAATYTRECTALQVTPGERVLLADHRILPLSWTRDAYWQALLLLSEDTGSGEHAGIVADHLRWLFLRCERPDGSWVRSHLANGSRKDRAFQADQQLYPLLELCDYASATGRLPGIGPQDAWPRLVEQAWERAERAIDPALDLIRSDENPADDRAGLPFLCSNQVLLWHTARRLAELARLLAVPARPFAQRALRTRAAVERYIRVAGPFGPQWAYAVNGRGEAQLMADANDLPAALAPLWGFCPPDDTEWRATMRFAFDVANPCFVAGPQGGLGSLHTLGPWTLGEIQRWVWASLCGDAEAATAALRWLVDVAGPGGMLPETYDPVDGNPVARRWFAWPGAALGALTLRRGAQPRAAGEHPNVSER
jgi:hypothetical protein